ncbi:nucleoporin Nup186/Nup192/Nup205 [Protomyces lactucae-debilis]|uniref:Nucleoporin Nup186/Nup192/Nup205 n=1 Tax=Protomyces lactucae-debilis TaxID=2754530 RepID=A0A1Y2EWP0_PROLT|nr:nucleoporin Nup186/Nup192/Nup205 [Protomyces lactucae-debilis]ORY76022.1 nucleoporin Nup186/Nup192/Nup205 [Protomyces lactucae-debilis]
MAASEVGASIEYLVSLRTALVNLLEEYTADQGDVLEDHAHTFLPLLDTKGPSAASRKQIESGKCDIDGEPCELNKEFIDKCLALSKHLELDEVRAAELLQEGALSSTKYDRPPFACAVFLYHTKRQLLLDCMRLVLESAADENIDSAVQQICVNFIDRVTSGDVKAFIDACLRQLQLLKRQYQEIGDGSEAMRVLRVNEPQQDDEMFQTLILDQYECLVLLLCNFCKLHPEEHHFMFSQLESLSQTSKWSEFVSLDLILIARSVQNLSASSSSVVASRTIQHDLLSATFRKLIAKLSAESKWSNLPLRSILQAIVASELNGLCRDLERDFASFDYDRDVASLFSSALEGNVFQHMLTSYQFATCDVSSTSPFAIFIEQGAYSFYQASAHHSKRILLVAALTECYRSFEHAFVTNLPDQLKTIKLRAEDDETADDELTPPTESGPRHLELFFGLVHTLAVDGPEHNREFWDDPDGDLHGFLVWGSYCEVPSMIYAYCMMLGALIADPFGSNAALTFLSATQSQPDAGQLLPSSTVSWPFLFDSFRYYIRHLNGKSNALYQQDILEVDAQNSLILKSYLYVARQLSLHISEQQHVVDLDSKFDCLASLFQLLSCPLPKPLYAEIIDTICAMAARQHNLQIKSWKLFETWVGSGLANLQQELAIKARAREQQQHGLDALLFFAKSSPDLTKAIVNFLRVQNHCITNLAFQQLSMNGSANQGLQYGVARYVEVVFDLLEHVCAVDNDLSAITRIELMHACMAYFEESLDAVGPSLLLLSKGSTALGVMGISGAAREQYMTLHPATRVLSLFAKGTGSKHLFNLVESHNIQDATLRAKLEPCLEQGLKVLDHVLFLTPLFANLEEWTHLPKAEMMTGLYERLLSDPSLVVHLCSLCVSASQSLTLPALAVLRQILASCGDDHQQRVLSMLVSVDHVKPILLGFAQLIELHMLEGAASETGTKSLLNLILDDLIKHQGRICVAHFILGFHVSNNASVQKGDDPGQVGSGSSVLHAVIQAAASPDTQPEAALLAMQILMQLVEFPMTVSLVFEEALPLQITQDALQAMSRATDSDLADSHFVALRHTLDYRAAFQRYATKELLYLEACDAKTDKVALLNMLASPNSEHTDESGRTQAPLCSFMDVFQTRLPTLLVPPPKYFVFEALSVLLTEDPDALRTVTTAVNCRLEQLRGGLGKEHVADAVAEARELCTYAANYLATSKAYATLVATRQSWTNLAVSVLDSASDSQPDRSAFLSVEFLELLLPSTIKALAETDVDIETMVDAACLIVTRSHLFAISPEQQQHFQRTLLVAALHPAASNSLREKLYVAIATLVNQALVSKEPDHLKLSHLALRPSCAKTVDQLCQGVTQAEGLLQLSACILLDAVITLCDLFEPGYMPQMLIRSNLLMQLINHFARYLLSSDADLDITERQFDLLLRLCMQKELATEIVQRSHLFDALIAGSASRTDDIHDLTRAPIAVATMRLVATCCITLKPAQALQLLDKYEKVLRDSAMRYKQAMQQNGQEGWTSMASLCSLLDEMMQTMR